MKRLAGLFFTFFLAGCILTPLGTATPYASPNSSLEFTPSTRPTIPTATQTAGPLPEPTQALQPTTTPTPVLVVRFAVIGDYGSGNQNESDVADLIKSWNPDFIITTGDNNYPSGQASTIDHRIGQFFHEYIYRYHGEYGPGAEQNRFFPTLGNHDWMAADAQPYLDYFSLPGNERYYDFVWGPVHLFAIDSDSNEPDGVSSKSIQARWLMEQLRSSGAVWKIVYMHQPPYSSGLHGSVDWARWPYRSWGASAVLGGHDHSYERLVIEGLPYFVNGLGGGDIYPFREIVEGSQKRFNGDYGAMLVEASENQITFQFITRKGQVIDTFNLDSTK
jgi:hypothetical protein